MIEKGKKEKGSEHYCSRSTLLTIHINTLYVQKVQNSCISPQTAQLLLRSYCSLFFNYQSPTRTLEILTFLEVALE